MPGKIVRVAVAAGETVRARQTLVVIEAMKMENELKSKRAGKVVEVLVTQGAAVEGNAMAGGFELMQACDIALVADDARLADNHSNFGQVPGGGGSQRLPRIVGRQRALAHILTGDRLTGSEAAAWGLAYRAVPTGELETTVDEVAAKLAGKAPAAVRRIKHLVDAGLERSLSDGLELERATVLEHLRDASAAEGIEAFKARA